MFEGGKYCLADEEKIEKGKEKRREEKDKGWGGRRNEKKIGNEI